MRQHPLRTILAGVFVLIACGAAGYGAYWYTSLKDAVLAWSDAPDAAVGATPPFTNWEDTPYNIYGGSAVQVVQDGERTALRFVGAANAFRDDNGIRSQRAELVPRMPAITPGQEVWVGMDIKLNATLGVAKDYQNIMQLKADTEGSPTLALTANTNEAGLDVRRTTGPGDGDTARQPLGPLPTEQYSRLVIGMKVTRSASSSWVEVWRDGEPKLLRANWDAYNQAKDGASGGLLYDNAQSAYLKFGMYRGPQTWPMDVRMSDIKIGPNRDSVK